MWKEHGKIVKKEHIHEHDYFVNNNNSRVEREKEMVYGMCLVYICHTFGFHTEKYTFLVE